MAVPHYAILRFAKYKGPEISGIEAHNERTKEKYESNPDIDPTRTHLNFHLIKPERKYRAESEKQIAEAGCRTRSDSVRVVEALITATPEFFKGKKRSEMKAYFEEAVDFIKQHRDFLLGQNHINPGDDKALYSYTPFIDALSKKEAIDND